MTDAAFWQKKIIQLFHDPPVKVFWLFRKGGHAEKAKMWLDLFANSHEVWKRFRSPVPDWVSTGADRPVLGSSETRVDWWAHPVTRHPLDGTMLTWTAWDDEKFAQTIETLLGDEKLTNWSDPDELKRKFLWLWRALPDLLMKQHGPLWSVLPADSRIPDHSIWDHLRMASAYVGASDHPHFFVFAIGPVQTFIHQARTSRDLWIGSYLLADLTWAAMQPLVEEYGPDAILYPSLFGNPLADQWLWSKCRGALPQGLTDDKLATCSSMLPHKFVALLPRGALEKEVPEFIPQRCCQAVTNRWTDLAGKVKDHLVSLIGSGNWTSTWDRQLKNGPDCRWVAVPWNTVKGREAGFSGWFPPDVWNHYEATRQVYERTHARYVKAERGFDYALTHHKVQLVYAARKEIADFAQTADPGIKCSVCGEREVLHDLHSGGSQTVKDLRDAAQRFWRNRKLDPDGEGRERLCGMCAFKRFLTDAETTLNNRWARPGTAEWGKAPFPSTSTIAALPFLLRLVEHSGDLQDEITAFVDAFDAAHLVRTFHLSGLPALQKQVEASPQRELLEKLFRGNHDRKAGIDAEYLFPEIWRAKIREAKAKTFELQAAQNAAESLVQAVIRKAKAMAGTNATEEEPALDPPSRHFAVLMMDGDHMGRLLLGDKEIIKTTWQDVLHPMAEEKVKTRFAHTGWQNLLGDKRLIGPALHAFISRALAHFAYEVVPWLVEDKHQSRLIYVGGDDLLAMAPAEKVLDLAQDLQAHFSAAFLTGDKEQRFTKITGGTGPTTGRIIPMLGNHASLSAAIVIAHHKQPLRPLLNHARNLLEETAKQALGRSAFAISLFTRSGEKVTFGAQWEKDGHRTFHDLNTVIEAFRKQRLPGGIPYHVREMAPALVTSGADSKLRSSLLRRQLEKSRGRRRPSEDEVQAIERLVERGLEFVNAMELDREQLVNALLLARFLGLQLAQAGGE